MIVRVVCTLKYIVRGTVFILVVSRMAVPPTYADLGKAARDLFNKGYSK